MTRKIKLDITMKSGAVVRMNVAEYRITHRRDGSIETFKWEGRRRYRRQAITLEVNDIDAVVRVNR